MGIQPGTPKVIDQKEPVGHAVRAMYMFSGMADVAALTGDTAYLHAIDRIWENVVTKKMYVTGGIGQTGGNEGFGKDYDLPNMSAYCETCASIAEVFLNYRLFLLHGDAKYIDIMERVMYNAFLSGVSLSGDLFFYDNPLESAGQHERQKWFGCACCPSNISRFLPSVTGYVYAHKGDDVYINLFTESETSFETTKGKITLTQKGNYPWDGESVIHVYPEYAGNRTIYIRIPGWARNEVVPGDLYEFADRNNEPVLIRINGEEVKFEIEKGYAILERRWQRGDSINLSLPMPVRKVIANEQVTEDRSKFILQRGPLVYCAEDKDQLENSVLHIFVEKNQEFKTGFSNEFGREITTIEFSATDVRRNLDGSIKADDQFRVIKAIPYCLWANRGPGEMITWIPIGKKRRTPTLPRQLLTSAQNPLQEQRRILILFPINMIQRIQTTIQEAISTGGRKKILRFGFSMIFRNRKLFLNAKFTGLMMDLMAVAGFLQDGEFSTSRDWIGNLLKIFQVIRLPRILSTK